MKPEFSGIDRRLERLNECLSKLEPLTDKSLEEIKEDPYLEDVIERNLEVAAQSCIDISNRIISLEGFKKPADYYQAIEILGENQIIPGDFAAKLAPIAGFRNLLVHQYLDVDQDEVYRRLKDLGQLYQFRDYIRVWLSEENSSAS
ncbi:MAG: type VII toxin-antitoxin system HepT family RNase toxin [Candidatus Acetothermia bacterium]